MNIWPPYFGAGIWVSHVSSDLRKVIVTLRSFPWNLSYRKTHFGGSLYAMTDPFYMIMLQHVLGENYNVWDKSSEIHYVRPATGKVKATFILEEDRIVTIKNKLSSEGKIVEDFLIEVMGEFGLVCKVTKTIHINIRSKKIEKSNRSI
jgi:hypothetical protein